MSWIAEYDTQGREFPTCVHVTKATGTMMHGATYVPIKDGKAVRVENAKLRELAHGLLTGYECGRGELCEGCTWTGMEDPHEFHCPVRVKARELGVEVDR